MVCVRVAFHENDGNHETTKTTRTAKNKELSAGFAEITETTEMTKTTGIQGAKPRVPQTTGLEIPDFLEPTLTLQSLLFSISLLFSFFRFSLLFLCVFPLFSRILGVPRREKPVLFGKNPCFFSKKARIDWRVRAPVRPRKFVYVYVFFLSLKKTYP